MPVAPVTTLALAGSSAPTVPDKKVPPPQALDLPTPTITTNPPILSDPPPVPTLPVPKDHGLPRLSLDMPPLAPSHDVGPSRSSMDNPAKPLKSGAEVVEREVGMKNRPMPERSETGLSTIASEPGYAALDSDEE